MADFVPLDDMLRDLFPLPGQEVKPWVKAARAERVALERTGRRVVVAWHEDNCGSACRNVGSSTLVHDMVTHDCCGACNDAGEALERTNP